MRKVLTAHIPGGWPGSRRTCLDCRHYRLARGAAKGLCAKVEDMPGCTPAPLSRDTDACKYYEVKE